MDRGTYAAASAGMLNLLKLSVVSNNLANASTVGFKKQDVVGSLQKFENTLAASEGNNNSYAKGDNDRVPNLIGLRTVTDFSPGSIQTTGNPLDVALREAKDFFVIAGPEGTSYTRAGNFSIDQTGQLVTSDGFAVQGDGGAITIPEGGVVTISENGEVKAGDQPLGKLQVVRFEDTSNLNPTGGTRYQLTGAGSPQTVDPAIVAGSVELPNTSIVTSMVDLISVNRAFASYVKTAQSIDDLNRQAINDIGRG
ncbi:MAG: flagellar hook-basal body protein [bacterium]|nr:flagellar hook-basal body protein [bacterium]